MSEQTSPSRRVDETSAFAEEWIAAWNAHDLDRIMGHYSPDVVFTSPLLTSTTSTGTVHTAPDLRAYFGEALARHPQLHFQLLGAFAGVDSVTVVYRTHRGPIGAETMTRPHGEVTRGIAHYGHLLLA